jgi:coproporphyrinogen III oxidase-like Fe-S oxidoreductase
MLYAHVPFCEQLCPYCSFNRYPFSEERARPYFANLRSEMRMLSEMGYDFKSLYIGGGTPTIIVDELCQTIDLARELFSVREVSTETNPNHLVPEVIERLAGKVQRLSVGVQSFDDELLRQMQRFGKYGSGVQTLERIIAVKDAFDSLNVDMIFNFPSQTEDMLINDLACILESHANQVTFYPLMASPAVSRSLARTVGHVDYRREQHYYQLICDVLTGRKDPPYVFGSAWTFNARNGAAIGVDVGGDGSGLGVGTGAGGAGAGADGGAGGASAGSGNGSSGTDSGGNGNGMIDEYIVNYEEYPAIGSGGLSYLDGALYVNTFSVKDYNKLIESGRMSIIGRTPFSKWDRMRYRFMMQLFGLRLDKKQWRRDFGCSVARGLPAEYTLFKLVGAIAYEDEDKILLSPKGRYLLVALMREFFIGVNKVRDEARASLDNEEHELLFGR